MRARSIIGGLVGLGLTLAAFGPSRAETVRLGAYSPQTQVCINPSTNLLESCGSGSIGAGSAIIGKVGIDQTTPGTTNGVVATGDTASAATDSGSNPLKVGCVYLSTLPTYTNGQRTTCQVGARGNAYVTLYDTSTQQVSALNVITDAFTNGAAGLVTDSRGLAYNGTTWDRIKTATAVDGTGLGAQAVEEGGRSFSNITTATTTTVKSGVGQLHTLTINTFVASATITIYNNTAASGTKIATITLPSTITSLGPLTLTYDDYFSTGLTIVTSGATDLTVSYR